MATRNYKGRFPKEDRLSSNSMIQNNRCGNFRFICSAHRMKSGGELVESFMTVSVKIWQH